jgi:hypothetical protein
MIEPLWITVAERQENGDIRLTTTSPQCTGQSVFYTDDRGLSHCIDEYIRWRIENYAIPIDWKSCSQTP